jgi:hypothetical protein
MGCLRRSKYANAHGNTEARNLESDYVRIGLRQSPGHLISQESLLHELDAKTRRLVS